MHPQLVASAGCAIGASGLAPRQRVESRCCTRPACSISASVPDWSEVLLTPLCCVGPRTSPAGALAPSGLDTTTTSASSSSGSSAGALASVGLDTPEPPPPPPPPHCRAWWTRGGALAAADDHGPLPPHEMLARAPSAEWWVDFEASAQQSAPLWMPVAVRRLSAPHKQLDAFAAPQD
jgi:hypothetical protein